jgi:hypothetical protein
MSFQHTLLQQLHCLFLQMQHHSSASTQSVASRIQRQLELISSTTFPDILLVIGMLADDSDFVGGQEWGIEPHPELANQVEIAPLDRFYELGGAWLGHCP